MGRKINDLTNQRFGRLRVYKEAGRNKHGEALWECICDCGDVFLTRASSLRAGLTTSCGCYRAEYVAQRFTTHGGWGTRLYRVYRTIKRRCYSPADTSYKYYGGRGISICDEWFNSFEVFRDWALTNGYTELHNLHRFDTNGDYCPENCYWSEERVRPSSDAKVVSANNKVRTSV